MARNIVFYWFLATIKHLTFTDLQMQFNVKIHFYRQLD